MALPVASAAWMMRGTGARPRVPAIIPHWGRSNATPTRSSRMFSTSPGPSSARMAAAWWLECPLQRAECRQPELGRILFTFIDDAALGPMSIGIVGISRTCDERHRHPRVSQPEGHRAPRATANDQHISFKKFRHVTPSWTAPALVRAKNPGPLAISSTPTDAVPSIRRGGMTVPCHTPSTAPHGKSMRSEASAAAAGLAPSYGCARRTASGFVEPSPR